MSDQLPSPCPMPSDVRATLLMVLLSFQDDYGKHRFIAEARAWVRAQPVGEAARDDNPATLGNAWPDLPDLPDGVDRFSQHPIAGEPPAQGERG